jgi:hypothetical protein
LFTPATNDTVVDVAGIDINGADWVTLRLFRNTQNQTPFSIDDDGAGNSPDNITFEDLDGPWFDVLDDNATGILISGGDYGPCDANAGNDNQGCTARMLGTGTTVDGATIHNITTTDATNFHVDGVFIRGCIDCVVRNSTFYNNQIQNIRIQNCCSLPDNDGTQIYNNWFGFAWSNEDLTGLRHGAIDVDNAVPDMVIAFNSFASSCEGGGTCAAYPSGVTSGTPTNPALIYGNLTGRTNASCTTDTNFSYNVYKKFGPTNGVSCDATEVLSNDPFPYVSDPVTSGAIDFNITGATWSGDELVPASLCDDYPADKNGNRSRNDGNGCDAGALER